MNLACFCLASSSALMVPMLPTLRVWTRQAQVVGWRCWGGEVEDVIDLAVDAEAFGDVAADQGEARAWREVRGVGGRSGDEVVQAGDVEAAGQQVLA
jgi:hypothetical protein